MKVGSPSGRAAARPRTAAEILATAVDSRPVATTATGVRGVAAASMDLGGVPMAPVALSVDGWGNLVFATDVLGFIPVRSRIDTEGLLEGQYGRSLAFDLRSPGRALLSGFHLDGLPLPTLPLSNLPALPVAQVQVDVTGDHVLRLLGTSQVGIRFGATVQAVRTGNGCYEARVSNVRLFSSQVPVPDWLVRSAIGIASALHLLPVGVQRSSDGNLAIDLHDLFPPA